MQKVLRPAPNKTLDLDINSTENHSQHAQGKVDVCIGYSVLWSYLF